MNLLTAVIFIVVSDFFIYFKGVCWQRILLLYREKFDRRLKGQRDDRRSSLCLSLIPGVLQFHNNYINQVLNLLP